MNIQTFSTNESLNEAAAQIIINLLKKKPEAVLGLATGSTPIGIYRELVRRYEAREVSFHQAVSFNLDEYVGLPEKHEQSYHRFMQEHLFDHIDINPANIHILNGNAVDLAEECQHFDKLLQQKGRIDLQILGLGHNGHIGFNEPGHVLSSQTHVVNLSENTIKANARFFTNEFEVPKQAVTMGVSEIMKAKCVLLVVRGSDKAQIVYDALTGPITTEVPASLLQVHPNLIVMLDAESGVLFHAKQDNLFTH